MSAGFKPVCMIGDLSGPEGNFFVVAGRVAACLGEFAPDRLASWTEQSKAGTYADMLRLLPEFVEARYTGMDAGEYLDGEG
jgi:hypothetical protein